MASNHSQHQYSGGCHCQSVRWTLTLPQAIENTEVLSCNCSMCDKLGFLHIIVPKESLSLNLPLENLQNYQFNKKIAKHYFCKNCGIKSFYQPRSHPENWSVNARCLDDFSEHNIKVKGFDGKNWEQNIESIL